MMPLDESLAVLARHRGDAVVVSTMAAAIPWQKISNTALDFPSAGSAMGHAADFALGIALAQPSRDVWCLNGDGSMLMTLETLVTVCRSPAARYRLFVFQNETYEVTGNQPTPGAGRISFADMARAAGFSSVHEFAETELLDARLPEVLKETGPSFINLRIASGKQPAPSRMRPLTVDVKELRAALGVA